MAIALTLIVVLVVVVGAARLATRVRHPEDTASHSDGGDEDSTSDRFYTDSRPAGPDAEDPVLPPDR